MYGQCSDFFATDPASVLITSFNPAQLVVIAAVVLQDRTVLLIWRRVSWRKMSSQQIEQVFLDRHPQVWVYCSQRPGPGTYGANLTPDLRHRTVGRGPGSLPSQSLAGGEVSAVPCLGLGLPLPRLVGQQATDPLSPTPQCTCACALAAFSLSQV